MKMNIFAFIFIIIIFKCKAESSTESECASVEMKELILTELDNMVPAISARLTQPLTKMKNLLKRKLKKMFIFLESKLESEDQSVSDHWRKGGLRTNNIPAGELNMDKNNIVAAEENNEHLMELFELLTNDMEAKLKPIVTQLDEQLSATSTAVEESIEEAEEFFLTTTDKAISGLDNSILGLRQRLEAIEAAIVQCQNS